MKVQGANASSVKTKQLIRTAFLQMHSEEIAGDKMTITDLTRRAGISRSTFYTHYSDLYEVGDEIAAEALQKIFAGEPKDAHQLLHQLLDFVLKNENSCRMLLKSDYPVAFFQQLGGRLKQRLRSMEHDTSDIHWNLKISVFVDGMIQQLISYFQNDQNIPLDQLCSGLINIWERF